MRSARRPGSGGLIRTLRQLITLPRWFHPFERSSRFIPSPTLFVEIRLSMCGFRSGAGNDRTRLRRKGRPCHVTFLTVPTSRAGGTECFQRRGPETEPVTRAHQEPASIRRPSTTSRTPPPHMGGGMHQPYSTAASNSKKVGFGFGFGSKRHFELCDASPWSPQWVV